MLSLSFLMCWKQGCERVRERIQFTFLFFFYHSITKRDFSRSFGCAWNVKRRRKKKSFRVHKFSHSSKYELITLRVDWGENQLYEHEFCSWTAFSTDAVWQGIKEYANGNERFICSQMIWSYFLYFLFGKSRKFY